MPYTNIALDVGASINAYKFLWNTDDMYDDNIIHLGSFHSIKENFHVRYSYVKVRSALYYRLKILLIV